MNDRELLEMAAKAAGYQAVHFCEVRGVLLNGHGRWFNPLEDDGEALRLAVALEMQLRLRHSENEVYVYGAPSGRVDESVIGDPLAATRRAIVRAAAEIGGGHSMIALTYIASLIYRGPR